MIRFFFKKSAIKNHLNSVQIYVAQNFEPPKKEPVVRYCLPENPAIKFQKKEKNVSNEGFKYSERDETANEQSNSSCEQYSFSLPSKSEDKYNATEISQILTNRIRMKNISDALNQIGQNINLTFVEKLLYYIDKKGVRDSEVYKAAQIDKRLFSKMVSNRQYQPSKDTAIALAFALKLSFNEACDFICRAGYTFSHSNKRDVIIEYFFREKVYDLIEINGVLYQFKQKLIGRL